MEWNATEGSLKRNYAFLTSAVAPRPIAWVTTCDAAGRSNAAPFSWYNAVCGDPPMVMIAIRNHEDGGPKDTLRNIRSEREFVVNIATRSAASPLVASSAEYPADVSEIEALRLATTPSHKVQPPRLADSPAHLECVLYSITPLGKAPGVNLVIGEVVHFAAADDALDVQGNLDPSKVEFLARMGGPTYSSTAHHWPMERPGKPT